jgi:FAD/FMN-containing dehydrogenase
VQIGPIPYVDLNAMLDAAYPPGALNYWKSGFLDEFADGAIDTLVKAFAETPVSGGSIVVEHFHGAVTRVPADATACELRRPGYNCVPTSVWHDPCESDADIAWTRETHSALTSFTSSFRYVNYFSDDDLGDAAGLRAAYPTNSARLAQVKREYDPDNVFRLNLNIPPA